YGNDSECFGSALCFRGDAGDLVRQRADCVGTRSLAGGDEGAAGSGIADSGGGDRGLRAGEGSGGCGVDSGAGTGDVARCEGADRGVLRSGGARAHPQGDDEPGFDGERRAVAGVAGTGVDPDEDGGGVAGVWTSGGGIPGFGNYGPDA